MEIVKATDTDIAKLTYILGWSFVFNCIEIAVVGATLQEIADHYGDEYGLHSYILGLSVIATFFLRLNPHLPKTYQLLKDIFSKRVMSIIGQVTSIREENFRLREYYLVISINNEEFTIEKTEFGKIDTEQTYTIRYFQHSRVVTSLQKTATPSTSSSL